MTEAGVSNGVHVWRPLLAHPKTDILQFAHKYAQDDDNGDNDDNNNDDDDDDDSNVNKKMMTVILTLRTKI